jgi:tellurite resistance protein TehA-like permease
LNNLAKRFKPQIAEMPPASFAVVMSTGIVSIACHLLGWEFLALTLFWLNLGLFLTLWCLTLLRLGFYPWQIWADLRSHTRSVGFFTMIAGTAIMASQLVIVVPAGKCALGLGLLSLALWLFLIYAVFIALIIQTDKPSLSRGLNGIWLVAPVSTQALSILTCLLVSRFPEQREALLFLALGLFLVGILLALLIVTLIFYRLLFFPLEPQAFDPSYWIMSGVDAITAYAGATLTVHCQGSQVLEPMRHVLVGLTVFFWATATWWIPLLVILMVWRHHRVKLAYAPPYWGMVFPLGMYATCTVHLAGTTRLPFLLILAHCCLYIAVAFWFLTFLGMCRLLWHSFGSDSQTGNGVSVP